MTYRQIFERTFDHLDGLGIDYAYIKSSKAEPKAIRLTEKALGLKLPAPLRGLYADFSDGLHMHWSAADGFGGATVANLDDLIGNRAQLDHWPTELAHLSFKPPMGSKKFGAMVRRMKKWIPIAFDGTGDCLCVDCGKPGGPVVFCQGAWYADESRYHGHHLAPDFETFLLRWSRVCFLNPLWWPTVIGECEDGWDDELFPAEFRI